MNNPSIYTNNAVFQLSLSSKELFHSNFLYWLATDNTLNPYSKGPNLTQNFFNQLLNQFGSSLANTFNLDDYAVFREYEHFDFSIWEKKRANSEGNTSSSAQNKDVKGEESLDDNDEEQNENAEKEVSYEGTCDTKELGKAVLVLENKFKSIPYQEQLDYYAGKILRINQPKTFSSISNKLYGTKKTSQQAITEIFQEYIKVGYSNGCAKVCKNLINSLGCEFYLLTLAQNFPARSSLVAGGLWKITDYTKYANYLSSGISLLTRASFVDELIRKYIDFISNFSIDINTDINNIKQGTCSIDVFKGKLINPYHSIRMHDIWQKLVMSKLVFDVKSAMLKSTGKNIMLFSEDEKIFGCNKKSTKVTALKPRQDIYIGIGYGSSGAYLEIKYKIDQDHAFIVQVQNNCYRRGILYDKSVGLVKSAPYGTMSGSLHLPKSVSPRPGTGTLDDFFVKNTPPQTPVIKYEFTYPKGKKGSGTFTNKKGVTYKFNTFGANSNTRIYFPYQYVSLDLATIGDMINAIVNDICKVIQMYP